MGFFKKRIPERKWPEVTTGIVVLLRKFAANWLENFIRSSDITDGLTFPELSARQREYVNLIQVGGVAGCLLEYGYLRNMTDHVFFLELVYCGLTENPPQQLHDDIDDHLFGLALFGDGFVRHIDIHEAISIWSQLMAAEFSRPQDENLIEKLRKYGFFTVIHARIWTCELAGDRKAADKIRAQVL